MSDKISSILNILKSRDFSELIGIEEDLYFETKEKPYDLTTANGRYELAKDVSSFANSDGGILIIGLIHVQVMDKKTERVGGIKLLEKKDFDLEKYRGVIVEYIYPPIVGIEIVWINDLKNTEKGIAYIYVPKQDQNKKHFLIINLIEGNEIVKGIVFGIAQRIESNNDPLSKAKLHKKIQVGMSTTSDKLSKIEEKIDYLIENSSKINNESPISKISERINRIIENQE